MRISLAGVALWILLAGQFSCSSLPERAPRDDEQIPRPVPHVRYEPDYPRSARESRTDGYVAARYVVAGAGSVQSVEVVSSKPPGVFDQSVTDSIKRWRFGRFERDGYYVTHRPEIVHFHFYAGHCLTPPSAARGEEQLVVCVDAPR